jgi:hypothetical protein
LVARLAAAQAGLQEKQAGAHKDPLRNAGSGTQ